MASSSPAFDADIGLMTLRDGNEAVSRRAQDRTTTGRQPAQIVVSTANIGGQVVAQLWSRAVAAHRRPAKMPLTRNRRNKPKPLPLASLGRHKDLMVRRGRNERCVRTVVRTGSSRQGVVQCSLLRHRTARFAGLFHSLQFVVGRSPGLLVLGVRFGASGLRRAPARLLAARCSSCHGIFCPPPW